MFKRLKARRVGVLAATVAVFAAAAAAAIGATIKGPSSSEGPYVIPSIPSVHTASILTVGDSVNNDPASPAVPYRMAGIPDGLAAFEGEDGTFTVLMNHELGQTSGRVRAHGAAGAFVSKWIVQKRSLRVLRGEDLIKRVMLWTPSGGYAPATYAIGRLCSGDLPERSAFYNRRGETGYKGRIFLSGEEVGAEGKAFAHVLDGTSWELPYLGKMSWENAVANPATGGKTVVVNLDDSRPGQVYVYVGDKQRDGNPVERAGLHGGKLFGIKVLGVPVETPAGIPSGTRFELVEIPDQQLKTGSAIDTESRTKLVTDFARPEDGAWDPRNAKHFYWVTTGNEQGGGVVPSRLWRLNFDDPRNPENGGTIDTLLDGTEGHQSLDNLTVDRWRRVLIQEDPGNTSRLAKIWSYAIQHDTLTEIAQHDPSRFGTPATQDEESSGIIPLDQILGPGAYLFDVQWHSQKRDAELVEGGQLQALYYPPGNRDGEDEDEDGDEADED